MSKQWVVTDVSGRVLGVYNTRGQAESAARYFSPKGWRKLVRPAK